jgi:hypothetical protein
MEDMPTDPFMLMSFINMKLRDFYPGLDALCEDLGIERGELEGKLLTAGFEYNEQQNKFW